MCCTCAWPDSEKRCAAILLCCLLPIISSRCLLFAVASFFVAMVLQPPVFNRSFAGFWHSAGVSASRLRVPCAHPRRRRRLRNSSTICGASFCYCFALCFLPSCRRGLAFICVVAVGGCVAGGAVFVHRAVGRHSDWLPLVSQLQARKARATSAGACFCLVFNNFGTNCFAWHCLLIYSVLSRTPERRLLCYVSLMRVLFCLVVVFFIVFLAISVLDLFSFCAVVAFDGSHALIRAADAARGFRSVSGVLRGRVFIRKCLLSMLRCIFVCVLRFSSLILSPVSLVLFCRRTRCSTIVCANTRAWPPPFSRYARFCVCFARNVGPLLSPVHWLSISSLSLCRCIKPWFFRATVRFRSCWPRPTPFGCVLFALLLRLLMVCVVQALYLMEDSPYEVNISGDTRTKVRVVYENSHNSVGFAVICRS